MTTSIPELIIQLGSADFNLRALALAGLVNLGSAATSGLQEALNNKNALTRALAAQGLAEIGDPDSAESFAEGLADPDAHVRARCAQGLARLRDERALDALVLTINDFPDVLHNPHSLSTHMLLQYRGHALYKVVPLLLSDDLMTRIRAFLVVSGCIQAERGQEAWLQLWRSLGSYAPDAEQRLRKTAAERWAAWSEEYEPDEND